MFYVSRALLESEGIKLKSDYSIHSVTYDAIVYFFYLNDRLKKELVLNYLDSKEQSEEILGKTKDYELMEDYFYEKKKRGRFTYEMGNEIMKSKEKTSLDRAKRFRNELIKLIKTT